MSKVGNAGLAEDIIEAYAENPNNIREEIEDLSGKNQKKIKSVLEDGVVTDGEEKALKDAGFKSEFINTLSGGANGDGGAPLQARLKALASEAGRSVWGGKLDSRYLAAMNIKSAVRVLENNGMAVPESARSAVKDLVKDLSEVVHDEDADVADKFEAAEKLSRLGTPEAAAAFEKATKEPYLMGVYESQMISATWNLNNSQRETAIRILTNQITSSKSNYKLEAVQVLEDFLVPNVRTVNHDHSVSHGVATLKAYANDTSLNLSNRLDAYHILAKCGAMSISKKLYAIKKNHPEKAEEVDKILRRLQHEIDNQTRSHKKPYPGDQPNS